MGWMEDGKSREEEEKKKIMGGFELSSARDLTCRVSQSTHLDRSYANSA